MKQGKKKGGGGKETAEGEKMEVVRKKKNIQGLVNGEKKRAREAKCDGAFMPTAALCNVSPAFP